MLKKIYISLLFVPSLAFANGNDEGMMHDFYHMMGYEWMGMGWFWWFFILFFVIIVLVFVFSLKYTEKGKEKDPLSIAKERLAKGEITKKEFEDIKKELKKD